LSQVVAGEFFHAPSAEEHGSEIQIQNEKLAQEEELKDAKESHQAAKETIAELQQQLDSTQQDLTDALVSLKVVC
jgi:uncharacterized protein (DUF3084 family)